MPIYAYRCEECGFQKDALQKLSDPPLVDCPQCGKPKLAKQVTAAGFALKGTGWYVTDFRDSAKKPASASASSDPAAANSAPTNSAAAGPASATSAGSTTPAASPAGGSSSGASSGSAAPSGSSNAA
jgi:putative FmdB family regulatory protein